MTQLAEQIAVLDGMDLSSIDMDDGRIGQTRAKVDEYGRRIMPGVIGRRNVLDASEGANYSGGSSSAPGLPLLPSSIGLANVPNVLPTRYNVIDPSIGANYSGGSSYAPGVPLLPSSSGLAMSPNDPTIEGGYGAPGFGMSPNDPTIEGGYGAAGFGLSAGAAIDQDLAAAFNGLEAVRDAGDGRIGQARAKVDEYGRRIMPGVIGRRNVLDASEGGNYSGGSSYAPGLPLLPSSIGLAGLGDMDMDEESNGGGLDGLDDLAFLRRLRRRARAKFKKLAGRGVVRRLKGRIRGLKRMARRVLKPASRARLGRGIMRLRGKLGVARRLRRTVLGAGMTGGVPAKLMRPINPSGYAPPRAMRPFGAPRADVLLRGRIDGTRAMLMAPVSPARPGVAGLEMWK